MIRAFDGHLSCYHRNAFMMVKTHCLTGNRKVIG